MGRNIGKEKWVIIKNIIVTLLVVAFFVGILLVFYNMLCEEKRDNIITKGESSAYKTSTQFNEYLLIGQSALRMTSYTLDGMLRDNKSNAEIHEYLTGQSDAILNTMGENTTGMYAFINGEYLDGTDWVPPDDFVATERPWYIEATEKKGNITVVGPYLDAQTGEVMITLARSLSDGKSVVSFDLSLKKIQAITEESVSGNGSDLQFIVDSNGYVVSHSDKEEVGKEYSVGQGTLESAIMEKLNSSDSDSFEFYYGNSRYIVYATKLMDDWYCVSVKDATAVFEPLRIILVVTIVAVIVVVLIISIIMMSSSRRQLMMERMSKQLSATADIYVSMHEINFLTDTFSEVRNNKAEASAMIGETRNHCQEMIRAIMTKFSDESTRDVVLDFVDFSKLNMRLQNRNTITVEWLSADKKWRKSRYIVSERTPTGMVARAMYLIEDIDAEKSERDIALEVVKTMNEQISSVANIYFSMYDVDLINNSFREVKTHASKLDDFVARSVENAQKAALDVVEKTVSTSSQKAMKKFIDFSTLDERLKESNTITEEFLNRDGLWCRARFVISKCSDDGKLEHVLWLVESIDEEKRKRDQLATAAETLNARISSIANIYMTAHELDITNDTFTEIKSQVDIVHDLIGTTRTHAQATLLKVMDNLTDEAYIDDIHRFIDLSTLDRRMRKTDTITIEYLNNEKLWRRGRFVASKRDPKGRLIRVMWLSEDIDNEMKERSELINASERAIAASEAKSSFLSNMSHEIRTPINAVLGMNEMILRECEEKNIIAYSESIRTAGNTLLGIVNDILDFSKIEAGKMEIIPVDYDLSSVINDLVNMIQTRADNKGLKLILNISKDVPKRLHGDEVRIKQIITNILTNAVKYTEEGSVTFSIGYEKIENEPDDILLKVSVLDTGIGIKPEDMKKLFSEFDRIDEERNRNVEGIGLGMSITLRLLEMMGSTLEVESVYELGSKFSFRLKQQVVKWEELGDYATAYKASLGTRKKYREKFRAPDARVLVVDDTPMNLTVFESLLKQTAVKIDTASSGDEGLALAYDRKYDMIFLDHMMPEKDGIETLHELRSRPKDPNINTPAICLTANAISGAREQYLAAGFDDYLTKPIDSAKLEEMLLQYLPKEKIQEPGSEPISNADDLDSILDEDEPVVPEFLSEISEIDTAAGITNCGSVEGYISALKTYAGMIHDHVAETEKFWQAGDLPNATIKIHATKSTSRIIGAVEIGELAQELELAGKAGDTGKVSERIDELLERCSTLGERLKPLIGDEADEDDPDKPLISQDELSEIYVTLDSFVSSSDMNSALEMIEGLREYRVPENEISRCAALIKAATEYEYDTIINIMEDIKNGN